LKAKLGNNAIHGAFADAEVALPEFLGNDIGAGLGIQEPVADDLTNDFLGSAEVGFGSSFGAEKAQTAMLKEESSQLEIALAAETESCGHLVNVFGAAFSGDEHSQFARDFIVFGNRQGPAITLDAFFEKFDGNHGGAS
jgi:hypothetical protein